MKASSLYFKVVNEAEKNYKIHNREMLVIIRCLDEWRHLLEGIKSKFEIWSNHKNLKYFMGSQKLNHRQARWAFFLSRFNFVLKCKGTLSEAPVTLQYS